MNRKNILKVLAIVILLALVAAAQTIPAGSRITVRLGSELSSGTAKVGQVFDGSLARDIVANGKTVAKSGTAVKGTVTRAQPSGRLQHPGVLSVRLTSVGGQTVRTSPVTVQGKSHKKSNITKMGGGAAAGAIIGGLAGGGKGAVIGTLAGGAAGTGVAAATGKQEAVLPAESTLTFTTTGAASTRATKKK